MDLDALTTQVDDLLRNADRALARDYPGERPTRQPIHTVYVPADRYDAETVRRWGREAETAVLTHAETFLEVIGGDDDLLERVLEKLAREPIEDLRIDFEDGYGPRGDDEEDAAATAAGEALRESMKRGDASPFAGIRFKSFDPSTRHRGLRTLHLFLESLGEIPEGFTVTIQRDKDGKVSVKEHGDKSVGHGAAWGAGAGVVVGLFAPPLLAATAVGAGIGAILGKIKKSREEKKFGVDIEEYLAPGTSAVVAVVDDKWADRVENALTRAD